MTATEQASEQARHRKRPSRRRVAAVTASVLVAAGLLASAIVALRPDAKAATGYSATGTATTSTSAPAGTTATTKSVLTSASTSTSPSASPPLASASATPTRTLSTQASSTQSSSTTNAQPASGSAPLAGRIRPGVTYQGVATEYAAADGDGACLFGPAANMMIAAMNYTDYESAKACGAHILVRAANGASITVLITNECPLPCAPGQLDLSQQAFVALAGANLGRMPITWKLLSPADAGTISIRYKSGSSKYWCGIQVIGHRNPVASLEVRLAGGWRQLPRTDYNYFLAADGTGCGSTIRVTDIYGQQLVIDGITISPDVVQPTQVQFAQH